MDLLRAVEALQALHRDGEAERDQEDGVDQRAENLCPSPAVRVLKYELQK